MPLKDVHWGEGPFNIKSLHVKWQRGGHLAKSGSYLYSEGPVILHANKENGKEILRECNVMIIVN